MPANSSEIRNSNYSKLVNLKEGRKALRVMRWMLQRLGMELDVVVAWSSLVWVTHYAPGTDCGVGEPLRSQTLRELRKLGLVKYTHNGKCSIWKVLSLEEAYEVCQELSSKRRAMALAQDPVEVMNIATGLHKRLWVEINEQNAELARFQLQARAAKKTKKATEVKQLAFA